MTDDAARPISSEPEWTPESVRDVVHGVGARQIDPAAVTTWLIEVVSTECEKREEARGEVERLRLVLGRIEALTRREHLGRPRSGDDSCVHCLAFFALFPGAFGEHLDYDKLRADVHA